jgi:hypothetical protein
MIARIGAMRASHGKESRGEAGFYRPITDARSLQRSVDRREFGVELRADALNRGYNRQSNTAGDQAIFDRGRTGFIAQES